MKKNINLNLLLLSGLCCLQALTKASCDSSYELNELNEINGEETEINLDEENSENPLPYDCLSHHEKRELHHEEKAMEILREFMDPEKHPKRKWQDWLDELIRHLHHLQKYESFCQDLKKLKGERNPIAVGYTLKKYDNLLASDIKKKIEYMYANEKLKLISLLSKRMKVN